MLRKDIQTIFAYTLTYGAAGWAIGGPFANHFIRKDLYCQELIKLAKAAGCNVFTSNYPSDRLSPCRYKYSDCSDETIDEARKKADSTVSRNIFTEIPIVGQVIGTAVGASLGLAIGVDKVVRRRGGWSALNPCRLFSRNNRPADDAIAPQAQLADAPAADYVELAENANRENANRV